MPYTIAQLNQMSQPEFVEALGAIFEHTPAIAAQAWQHRPFGDGMDLYQKMLTAMQGMSRDQKLALICAHPDLGSRAKMAEASVQEQAGVGLDQLSAEEYDRCQSLNQAYKDKFHFPFIIAVKNHTKASILDAFTRRLQNDVDVESAQALAEIAQIAQFRLFDLVRIDVG